MTKSVPAVKRAGDILWLLAERDGALGVSEIARSVNILPSTALHILREMVAARLIAFDPTLKLYQLGRGIVDLAQAVSRKDDFAECSRTYLRSLASRFDVTATATVMVDENHTACVVSISAPGAMSLNVTLGGRVPTFSGAVGRCIAAYGGFSVKTLRRGFEQIRWQSALDFQTWLEQVRQVEAKGYAEDDGDFALGVMTLAAPIFTPAGPVTRAIGIATISAAIEPDLKLEIALALIEAATTISKRMSH